VLFARAEGLVPAPESCHAVAAAIEGIVSSGSAVDEARIVAHDGATYAMVGSALDAAGLK